MLRPRQLVEYIRALTLGREYRPPMDKGLRQAVLMVYRELTAWGNNINQIAKGVNSGTSTPTQTIMSVERIKEATLDVLRLARRVLSGGIQGPMP